MITEAILTVLLAPVSLLLGAFNFVFPVLTLPTTFSADINNLLSYVGWLLPLGAILPIFVFRFGLMLFNLVWKIILRIKSFIPTLGG